MSMLVAVVSSGDQENPGHCDLSGPPGPPGPPGYPGYPGMTGENHLSSASSQLSYYSIEMTLIIKRSKVTMMGCDYQNKLLG